MYIQENWYNFILRCVTNINSYTYTCNTITRAKMMKYIFAVRRKANTTDRQIFVTFPRWKSSKWFRFRWKSEEKMPPRKWDIEGWKKNIASRWNRSNCKWCFLLPFPSEFRRTILVIHISNAPLSADIAIGQSLQQLVNHLVQWHSIVPTNWC